MHSNFAYNKTTPVLFIVFNRPQLTKKVFEAIRKAEPIRLYIAADGPRLQGELVKCNQVRDIVKEIDWDCTVQTLFREENLGCKIAVSSAISWFFENEEEGIILEDDCLPSESFFGFCSTLLEKYRFDERIGHIGGCNFQFGQIKGDGSYYFSELFYIWGWASWKRVWKNYDVDLSLFESFKTNNYIKNTAIYSLFEKYWLDCFENTANKNIDTWDYQYMFSNIINNRLAIIPNNNLISNIGFGEEATHTKEITVFSNIPTMDIYNLTHPKFMIPDLSADKYHMEITTEDMSKRKKSLLSKIWNRTKLKLYSKD